MAKDGVLGFLGRLAFGERPEVEIARISGISSRILREVGASLRPGMSTKALETHAVALFEKEKLLSRMLHYRGYPAAISVSIDEEVIHGIPSETRTIEDGQLVSIHLGGRSDKGSGDQGWTFAVGAISAEKENLRTAGIEALRDAIGMLKGGVRTGDLGATIQEALERRGASPVRDFVGYAIGEKHMEPPQLRCYGRRGEGPILRAGKILHVQVMANAGSHAVFVDDADKWTVLTDDGKPSVLFTAVLRLTDDGNELLTPLLD